MSNATQTQTKLFDAIAATIDEVDKLQPGPKAVALSRLALAFRYAAGGQQPGAAPAEQ